MRLYDVTVSEVWKASYTVEADSEQEAIEKVLAGDGYGQGLLELVRILPDDASAEEIDPAP
jgi:hypothetical protein